MIRTFGRDQIKFIYSNIQSSIQKNTTRIINQQDKVILNELIFQLTKGFLEGQHQSQLISILVVYNSQAYCI